MRNLLLEVEHKTSLCVCKQWLASLWLVSASSLCGCGLVTREVQVQLPPYITANQAANQLVFCLVIINNLIRF